MLTIIRNRAFIIWAVLVTATILSARLFAHLGGDPRFPTIAVLLVALIKVRLIGLEFMELRSAPLPFRLAFEIWLASLGLLLIGLYWHQEA